jgi:hypothetical protein
MSTNHDSYTEWSLRFLSHQLSFMGRDVLLSEVVWDHMALQCGQEANQSISMGTLVFLPSYWVWGQECLWACLSQRAGPNGSASLCPLILFFLSRVRKQVVNIPSFIVRLDSQKHIDFSLRSPYGGGRPGRVKRKNAKKGQGGAGAGDDEEED